MYADCRQESNYGHGAPLPSGDPTKGHMGWDEPVRAIDFEAHLPYYGRGLYPPQINRIHWKKAIK